MPKDDAIARGPLVVQLDEPAASDTAFVGAKAANLAVAARAGLPVIPGFVVTTAATGQPGGAEPARGDAIHDRWQELSDDGRLPLAVRSSSVAEDSASSSMAGQCLSVLHVTGWDAFAEAVGEVVASAAGVGPVDAPIAVLVQPMARARVGGVMFGLDPLTGSRSRILVSMTDGLPEAIVSGQVTGTSLLLTRRGRLKSVDGTVPAAVHARQRGQLARLARRTARVFGAPQDMEWLIEPDGALRLLQSRPITAAVPVGPGPVAETFPEPLAHLELDLWVPPLEDGLREALRLSGATGRGHLRRRFVIDVEGRVAVDLEALGVIKPRRRWWMPLDPRPGIRRLRAAWRLGRLRGAFPAIVGDLVEEVDAALRAVPNPATTHRPPAPPAAHQRAHDAARGARPRGARRVLPRRPGDRDDRRRRGARRRLPRPGGRDDRRGDRRAPSREPGADPARRRRPGCPAADPRLRAPAHRRRRRPGRGGPRGGPAAGPLAA